LGNFVQIGDRLSKMLKVVITLDNKSISKSPLLHFLSQYQQKSTLLFRSTGMGLPKSPQAI